LTSAGIVLDDENTEGANTFNLSPEQKDNTLPHQKKKKNLLSCIFSIKEVNGKLEKANKRIEKII